MTSESATVGYGKISFDIYNTVAIFNVVLFSLVLVYIATLPKQLRKFIHGNQYAIIIIISIIIDSLMRTFVLTEVAVNFDSSCYADNSCQRCTIGGHLHRFFMRCMILALFLMFLRILEVIFQPIPFLAYPKCVILGFKVLIITVFIVSNITYIGIFKFKHRIYELRNHSSIHICDMDWNKRTVTNQKLQFLWSGALILGSFVGFSGLFINGGIKLYRVTNDRIQIHDMKKINDSLKVMVNCIVIPVVRYTILVLTITITFLIWALYSGQNPAAFPLDIFRNLIVGFSVIMLFPSGKCCFNEFCGWIERPLISKFVKLKSESLKRQHSDSFNQNQIELEVKRSEVGDRQRDDGIKHVPDTVFPVLESSPSIKDMEMTGHLHCIAKHFMDSEKATLSETPADMAKVEIQCVSD